MKKDIVLVVLAAGKGKRFWPCTTDKIFYPFLDKRFIDFAIPNVFPPEVAACVVVANLENAEFFASWKCPVPVCVVVQDKPSGMAGAIEAAKKYIAGKRIMILIADDLKDSRLMQEMLDEVRPDIFGVLTAWKPRSYFPGGYIVFRDNRPVDILEKPTEGKTPSEYVYFGGQYIANADILLDAIASLGSGTDDIYEKALSLLMKDKRFSVLTYDKDFSSLKYPWHILDVMGYIFKHHFTPGRGKNIDIRNNVSLEGPVYIGNNVKIFENTKIVGPVHIGHDSIIGNNNIIRESYIGNNCVTGFSTDITRSYIGHDCWFHNNYIGDSVLEGNVSMGSGSVLANLRLDEGEIYSMIAGKRQNTYRTKLGAIIGSDVRIGVNTSIMPGVKVGSNSCIGAGVVLDADISENSYCVGQKGYEVKKNIKKIPSDRRVYKTKI